MRAFIALLVLLALAGCGDDDDPVAPITPITPVNHAPVIATPPELAGVVGESVQFVVDVTDPDGDEYELLVAPVLSLSEFRQGYVPDAALDPETEEFRFIPGERDVPRREFQVFATDVHGAEATMTFPVAVESR